MYRYMYEAKIEKNPHFADLYGNNIRHVALWTPGLAQCKPRNKNAQ